MSRVRSRFYLAVLSDTNEALRFEVIDGVVIFGKRFVLKPHQFPDREVFLLYEGVKEVQVGGREGHFGYQRSRKKNLQPGLICIHCLSIFPDLKKKKKSGASPSLWIVTWKKLRKPDRHLKVGGVITDAKQLIQYNTRKLLADHLQSQKYLASFMQLT